MVTLICKFRRIKIHSRRAGIWYIQHMTFPSQQVDPIDVVVKGKSYMPYVYNKKRREAPSGSTFLIPLSSLSLVSLGFPSAMYPRRFGTLNSIRAWYAWFLHSMSVTRTGRGVRRIQQGRHETSSCSLIY